MTDNFPSSEGPRTPHAIDQAWLGEWLKAFHEQQQKQTNYLKNISLVATIIGLLTIISLVFGGCSVLTGF